jgi:hypothetical protein
MLGLVGKAICFVFLAYFAPSLPLFHMALAIQVILHDLLTFNDGHLIYMIIVGL